MSIPPNIQATPRRHIHTICVHCKAELEYVVGTHPLDEAYSIRCSSCKESWIVRPKASKAKRRIGSDERPLDMSFYEILDLPASCTPIEIKKAYRRLAIMHHPDKNPNDPTAGEKFKEIAVAYSTLSDPDLRHAYNEFGKGKGDGQSDESMVDPTALFSQLFGGERFQDIIGTISLGSDMKSAMQDDEEEDGTPTPSTAAIIVNGKKVKPILTPEEQEIVARKKAAKDAAEKKISDEKAAVREVRVKALIDRLRDKLALFTEQARGEEDEQIAEGVRIMWQIEAEELKQESYGVELLQTVGFVYSSKSRHYLASTGPIPFGLGGWFHSARSTVHIVSETVSTVRSAYALKDVFEALSAAETSGLSPEKKKELEDKAAQMGLQALFKGAKLEIESVIREVCDRILSEDLPLPDLRKRAVAIGILGSVFEAVKKDEGSMPTPSLTGAPPAPTSSSSTSTPKQPAPTPYRAGPQGTGTVPRPSAQRTTTGTTNGAGVGLNAGANSSNAFAGMKAPLW